MAERFAIYWAPPEGSILDQTACAWLGRDHLSGRMIAPTNHDGLDPARQQAITASPRHYGFHATLKAPFALRAGRSVQDLIDAGRDFAKTQPRFEIQLKVRSLNGFLALMLDPFDPMINALAEQSVRVFEPFRAPLDEDDIKRRLRHPLTERQDTHLRAWGYPYIFDDFRFHMTLTERLEQPEHDRIRALLAPVFAPALERPLPVREIALYRQPDRNAPFTIRTRFPFD